MNRWKYNIVYDDNLLSAFFFHAKIGCMSVRGHFSAWSKTIA